MEAILGFALVVAIVVIVRKNKGPKSSNKGNNSLSTHELELKEINKNAVANLFVGQILTIDVDAPEDEDGIIDDENVKYNLITYPNNTKIGTLGSSDEEYGEKYQYAILKEISADKITACIICEKVWINRFKFEPSESIANGELLEIEMENNQYAVKHDGKNVGTINDNRLNDDLLKKICYFSYDNGCAQALIKK